MYNNILLTTDGSDLADKAVQQGISLAAKLGARTTAVTVIKPLHVVAPAEVMVAFPSAEYEKVSEANAQSDLAKVADSAQQAGVACETRTATHAEAWRAIIDTAHAAGCDLIVMGSHGRTGLTKLVLGSEAQNVLAHSKVPVLIVR